MRTGFFLTALGFVLLSTADASTSDVLIVVALICTGAGMASVMPGASQHIVGSLPLSKAGVGSAVNDVTREVGGALGIAVMGSIVATVYRDAEFLEGIPPEPREIASGSIGQTVAVANDALEQGFLDRAGFDDVLVAAGEAFNDGTHIAFAVMAAVAVLSGIFITKVIPDELPQRQVGAPLPAP
jgi:hypothetical protein